MTRAATIIKEVPRAQEAALAGFLRNSTPRAFRSVGRLHFLSMFVVRCDADNPPLLCLEANFDGPRREFLGRLLAPGSPSLGVIEGGFGLCTGNPGAGAGVDAWREYLDSGEIGTNIFYVGSPGREVGQIWDEALFARAVERIARRQGAPESRRAANVRGIWDQLTPAQRDFAMQVPPRPFLVRWQPHRRPLGALYDLIQLPWIYWPLFALGLATFVLVAAQAAGSPVWPEVMPPHGVGEATARWAYAVLWIAGVSTFLWTWLFAHEFPAALTWRTRLGVIFAKVGELIGTTIRAVPGVAALLGLIAFAYWHWALFCFVVTMLAWAVGLAALGLGLVWVIRLIRIALREPRDRVFAMEWDLRQLAAVLARENDGAQNHFASVVPVREGNLRYLTLLAVLWWVGTLAKILYNPRGLFDTQSIHFARWTMLPGRRMLFLSNYAGSFNGYLGVFATLGAAGVSAIWGNTEEFPRTFILFGDGARDEQRFKARARASEMETLLWYRNYPRLSVAAIERNGAIREDLARFARVREQDGERISEAELDAFLRRLAYRVP